MTAAGRRVRKELADVACATAGGACFVAFWGLLAAGQLGWAALCAAIFFACARRFAPSGE